MHLHHKLTTTRFVQILNILYNHKKVFGFLQISSVLIVLVVTTYIRTF